MLACGWTGFNPSHAQARYRILAVAGSLLDTPPGVSGSYFARLTAVRQDTFSESLHGEGRVTIRNRTTTADIVSGTLLRGRIRLRFYHHLDQPDTPATTIFLVTGNLPGLGVATSEDAGIHSASCTIAVVPVPDPF